MTNYTQVSVDLANNQLKETYCRVRFADDGYLDTINEIYIKPEELDIIFKARLLLQEVK